MPAATTGQVSEMAASGFVRDRPSIPQDFPPTAAFASTQGARELIGCPTSACRRGLNG
jgi:hypothetical protein